MSVVCVTERPPPAMSSNRPYLLRAVADWISDNGLTPYLLVDAAVAGVRVPPHTVREGRVVLNIATRAVSQLELGNDAVRFMARFSGVSHNVVVPMQAVLAVYAQENGQGMMFESEPVQSADDANSPVAANAGIVPAAADTQVSVEGASATEDSEPPPPKGPPRLRVVK